MSKTSIDITSHIKREIFQLYRSGVEAGDIAKKYGLYECTVLRIICRDKVVGEWESSGEKVRLNIRECNDINKKWLIIDIVDALHLATRPRAVFINYYECKSRKMSLKEFMDLIVLENPIPDRLNGCTAVMRLRNMGRLGFFCILEQLTTLDLGENAKVEWNRKLELLRKYGRKQDLPPFIFNGFQQPIVRAC